VDIAGKVTGVLVALSAFRFPLSEKAHQPQRHEGTEASQGL